MRAAFYALTLVFTLSILATAASNEKLEDTISYLLNYISKSNATFIRNGTSHTPAEAEAHIRAKYDHFKAEIKTPEDFIRLCTSKSLMSGKPYLVRTAEGKEMYL